MSMIRKYHNHKLQTTPWHREPLNHHETPGRQIKQSNQLSLVLAGPLPLNQYACRSFSTQSLCMSIFYHSFLHACWCCVSLFVIPACMVSHYQPCLLVRSLTIGHAFWCDASLSAMPSGVLSHHRPRLLVWSLIINHAHWCGASL